MVGEKEIEVALVLSHVGRGRTTHNYMIIGAKSFSSLLLYMQDIFSLFNVHFKLISDVNHVTWDNTYRDSIKKNCQQLIDVCLF